MKKALLLLTLIAGLYTTTEAQMILRPDGTVISGFTTTDINSNVFSSAAITGSGKHFLIDISATWCPPCWNYHQSHVLKDYYEKYGPSGTELQDAEILFYEGDVSTTLADLNGTGSNTQGNWTSGTPYRFANPTSNVASVFFNFLDNASTSISYPSVFLVCADNKMYQVSTQMTDPVALRLFVNDKCGTAPLSTSAIHDIDFAYDVYPNPANDLIKLDIDLDKINDVSFTLSNSLGQVVSKELFTAQSVGLHNYTIESSNLSAGMYFLNLNVGGKQVTHKVSISH